MTQRSIFEEEPLPVRATHSGHCIPCRGSGWGAFIPGGGRICERCGGSGRQANKPKTERKPLA